ncbi:AMP-dependent synthetase/ligase [Kineosporia sp. NBRC 101731]|uniref:AMP-dependent synthetase/ligase n=1 Tax=Kineosporia sp. NBRC 101731 TaxID=3032199 RepID=UPI0024A60425|nr:AMP-dependent synthetase/ligase [Kineosporia sp. NBRC 101731]GLY32857.1 long-chain acyl-CoA synthetase [Kineosporia sp. NBRC 101731]
MREIIVPRQFHLDDEENLCDVVVGNAERQPTHVAFRRHVAGAWQDVTSAEFLGEVVASAKGLVSLGVQPGDRVALMARTRYEWTLLDVAIWFAGAVSVPVYETSSPEQVRWILSDSGAVAVVVETAAHRETVGQLREGLTALREVLTIDDGAVTTLAELGADIHDDVIHERRHLARLDTVLTLIYTSGTTGRPKGCELTHGNFVAGGRAALEAFGDLVDHRASTLLFLPLAHVFARYIQALCLVTGATMGHTPTTSNLLSDLDGFKPTFLLAVPRVFEKIYNGAEARAMGSGRGKVFARAARVAISYSQALDASGPGLGLKLQHTVFDRLVYAKLRAATGGTLRASVSGGAPLGKDLSHFFRGIGMPVLEGWGLTETTAPVSCNTPAENRIGTVGRPLPGMGVRIGDDGEIEAFGVGVMHGYANNPQATSDALHDGWFGTGDLGALDADGFLSITGRKKEMIVTANGKNVIPTVLEDAMRSNPLISQCIVVGDQKPFIGALITLDEEMLPTWLTNRGKPELDIAAAAKDPDVLAELQSAVDKANGLVSRAESVRKFRVLTVDLTEESGHLTPKQSLKRAVILKDFSTDLDALYS